VKYTNERYAAPSQTTGAEKLYSEMVNSMASQSTNNKLTGTRKLTVRLALASGATLATLFGAQSLSTRDLALAALLPTTEPAVQPDSATTDKDDLVTTTVSSAPAIVPVAAQAIAPAAPQIVIIQNSNGQTTNTAAQPTQPSTTITTGNKTVIVPPVAVVVAAPATNVTVDNNASVQPAPVQPAPRTRSSK
jgi:hypothetical protein